MGIVQSGNLQHASPRYHECMPNADDKVSQLQELYKMVNRNTATPDEVGQALYAIVQEVVRIQKELEQKIELGDNESIGEAGRGISDSFDRVRGLINASVAQAKSDAETLQKLIDGVIEWKDTQSSVGDDAAGALELSEENTAAIRKLRTALKEVSQKQGERGPRGRPPAHEWDDTRLRFQNPDKSWGPWVDLRGPGSLFGGFFGGPPPSGLIITRLTTNGTTGPATLSPSGVLNIPQYTGGSGSGTTQSTIDPSETPDDTRLAYTFSSKPFLIVVNQRTYRENHGWTWNAGTGVATLSATDPGPVGTGNEIYGIIQT